MFDIKQIKSMLTIEHIISIMENLGADCNFKNDKELHFKSICHNSQSHKLYYYIDNQSFYCHRCGEQWDIFALIQKVQGIDFLSAFEYVKTICHFNVQDTTHSIDEWQSMKRFLPNSNYTEPLISYDKSILSLFHNYYHESWLMDNISKETMNKFHIGWYDRNEQITIPVFNIDGDLIGIHGRNTIKSLIDKGLKYQPIKTLTTEYKFPTGKVLYGLYENLDNIRKSQSVIIAEAPKSVLQADNFIENNNVVALFGWNCNKERRDILLKQGVKTVTICLDKQYKDVGTEEFNTYLKQVKKIANLFAPYCQVYIVWDRDNLLEYKDSPFDKGKEIWERLELCKVRYN